MKIDDLNDFLMLYRYRNFSNAAAELIMTQASLSKRLQAIQHEIGAELVNTQNKRSLRITECGETFYRYAKTIVAQYELMRNEIQEYQDLKRGNLWIASIPVMTKYGLIDVLTQFMNDYPQINIRLEEIEGDVLLSKLESNGIDIGIIRDIQINHLNKANYQVETIDRDELMVILPKSSPMAGRPAIAINDLATYDFVLLNQGSGIYETITSLCQKAGFTPNICFYSTHISTIMSIIKSSKQVTFLFHRSAQLYMNDDLIMRHLSPPIFSDLQFIYSKNQNKLAIQRFLKRIQKVEFE